MRQSVAILLGALAGCAAGDQVTVDDARTADEADAAGSALDADVIKSYVELGLGIGIVAALAFNPERDLTLRLLDCTHLFPANLTRIAVREGQLQRQFADDFIALCTNSCKD